MGGGGVGGALVVCGEDGNGGVVSVLCVERSVRWLW